MKTNTFREFPVDNASILFLSLIRPYHTNSFRISATLQSPICPQTLQQAADRIHIRYPSVVAGVRQDFFHYRQVTSPIPPQAQPDPGLLIPMTAEELETCCCRIYYQDATISLEVFHALTDGTGAIEVLCALVEAYLSLQGPTQSAPLPLPALPQSEEVEDAYGKLAHVKPKKLPGRFSYIPSRPADADWQVRSSFHHVDAKALLEVAHQYGVTLNTLLTATLASSVMELQIREKGTSRLKPVRLMIPVNIRKLAQSKTLRNCSLYALPTMEANQYDLPISELCGFIARQLKDQLSPESLSAMASYNVRTQDLWFFRLLPWKLKQAALKLGYRFFGESNSSMTLTNLGVVKLPETILPYVTDFQIFMTPRVTSPYGCTVLSFGGKLTLQMSRFCPTDELGEIFYRKVDALLKG